MAVPRCFDLKRRHRKWMPMSRDDPTWTWCRDCGIKRKTTKGKHTYWVGRWPDLHQVG